MTTRTCAAVAGSGGPVDPGRQGVAPPERDGALPEGSEREDALAGRLGVEEAVGLLGLLLAPLMGQQAAQRHLAIGDEARALLLAGVRERPRGVQRDLPAEQVLADLERDVVALTDERDAAPGVRAAHRLGARL